MYILINKDKTEIRENVVAANLELAETPEGWTWIDNEDKLVAKIKAEMFKKDYANNRKKEYEHNGLDTDKLIVALWELIVEKRPEMSNDIQKKRTTIKKKYPKVK